MNSKERNKENDISNGGPRKIFANAPLENVSFCGNYVSTAKYTFYTFPFKFLHEQFMRVANFYFLVISILQLIPNLSSTGRYTTILGLGLVLSLNAVKEIFEDIRRHLQDHEVNRRKVEVLRRSQFEQIRWQDVKVGDFVKLKDGDPIPADMILLSSSGNNGSCFIETSGLDGESNLKIRQALPMTTHLIDENSLIQFEGIIECEDKNPKLHEFEGVLRTSMRERPVALTLTQTLLRGASLRNTDWIIGMVINTGKDTKLGQNSNKPSIKRSKVEKQANKQIIIIFILLALMSFLCAILSGIWKNDHEPHHWYLILNGNTTFFAFENFWTFVVLFSALIPISLYTCLEFLKAFQAFFINFDLMMYDKSTDTPARARTSNLNEELGQIEYIFSDKTGTLTENQMCFKCCCVNGKSYGKLNQEIVENQGKFEKEEEEKDPLVDFSDPNFINDLRSGVNSHQLKEFLVSLALCHTVVPQRESEETKEIKYNAASPDEAALVAFAKKMGVIFKSRTPERLTLLIDGVEFQYEILNIIEFTSTRKRMSVIVKTPDEKIKLYCKGADTVLGTKLASEQVFWDQTMKMLESFGVQGLRTLVIVSKEISKEEYQKWSQIMYEATIALKDREQKIQSAGELIETELHLIGATAIEDKLQEGVPQAIQTLAEMGIKTWMLTGDKQETAINIAFACNLLNSEMERIVLNYDSCEDTRIGLECLLEKYSPFQNKNLALIIDGVTLDYALHLDSKFHLLKLATNCQAVVCCRVSPLQKAQVVLLVKENLKSITLAIGDGGNDVGMIQAAHVGVGISGKEGTQAAIASDYSVAQFRFLIPLLLIHGTRAYRGVTKLIQYCFYKNIVIVLTQFWFTIQNGFSGQSLYEKWTLSFFNTIFTFFPIMSFGLFDREIAKEWTLNNPRLYRRSQGNELFKTHHMLGWVMNAILHATIIYWLSNLIYGEDVQYNGRQIGLWGWGFIVYTCVIFVVTLKLALESCHYSNIHFIAVFGSLVLWFAYNAAFAPLGTFYKLGIDAEALDVFYEISTTPNFWLSVVLLTIVCLWRDFSWKFLQRTYFPGFYHIVQEQEHLDIMEKRRKKPNIPGNQPHTGYSFYEGISVEVMNLIVNNIESAKLARKQQLIDLP